MNQSAKILCDSISEAGKRITTFELMLWRPLLAELNTHRALSKSAASSRAVPAFKRILQVLRDPFVPKFWGTERKGMRPGGEVDERARGVATDYWLGAARDAALRADHIAQTGVHKSLVNRILEPYLCVPVVVTGTEWGNFFALRTEIGEDGLPISDPHFYDIATMMLEAMRNSTPTLLHYGDWHLPYALTATSSGNITFCAVSAARCARVSYRLHDGRETTLEEDMRLFESLQRDGHMGPMEHQATPIVGPYRSGNFRNWKQFRQTLLNNVRRFTI